MDLLSGQGKYVIGVDVGGTNTDSVLVVHDTYQIIQKCKSTTSSDVITGIKNSLSKVITSAKDQNSNFDKSQVISVVIGTTHFVNAILQKGDPQSAEKLNRVAVIRLCGVQTLDHPPFCSIENEDLLSRIQGPSFFLNGGLYYNGDKEYTEMKEEEIIQAAQKIIESNIHNIVICGTFSVINDHQEIKCKEIVSQYCQKNNFPISITLSTDVCKKQGLLERENAAIINESLKYLSSITFSSYRQALQELELKNAQLFISNNDGSLMTAQLAQHYPILTFSASIINSLKGGSQLYNEQDGIVIDIGGTSTDIAVMSKGIPRTASKHMNINGITLNFRMPLVHSIALGGGSIVLVKRNQQTNKIEVSIQKESVAFKLLQSAVSFSNGDTLCNTDFAIYSNSTLENSIPGANHQRFIDYLIKKGFNQSEIEEIVSIHRKELTNKLTKEIETLISDYKQKVKILLVGGGACLVDCQYLEKETNNVCEVQKLTSDQDVANALGSTLTDITVSYDKEIEMEGKNEQEQIEEIKLNLIKEAEQRGALPPVEIVEIIVSKVQYKEQKDSKRFYIRAKGRFVWNNLDKIVTISNEVEQILNAIEPNKCGGKQFDKINYLFDHAKLPDFVDRSKDHHKPILEIKNDYDLDCLSWGCAILGSGGGGSVEKSVLLCKELLKKRNNQSLKIYDYRSLNEDDLTVVVGHYGAPSIFTEYCLSLRELFGSFEVMNKLKNNKLSGLTCCEVGGCNAFAPIIVSLFTGVPVFDCNTMCRAFPEFKDILPMINGQTSLPLVFGDAKNNRFIIHDFSFSNPPKLEEYDRLEVTLRDWVINHFGMMGGIAYCPVGKEYIEKHFFKDGYQQAYQVGKVMYDGIIKGQRLVEDVVNNDLSKTIPNSKVIVSGKIIESRREQKGGYDYGEVVIKQNQDESKSNERRVLIRYKNEFLIAFEQEYDEENKCYINGKPLVMTPDLITLLDEFKGTVIHSEDVCYGLRVIAIAMQVDPLYTTEHALSFVGPQGMKIGSSITYSPYY